MAGNNYKKYFIVNPGITVEAMSMGPGNYEVEIRGGGRPPYEYYWNNRLIHISYNRYQKESLQLGTNGGTLKVIGKNICGETVTITENINPYWWSGGAY